MYFVYILLDRPNKRFYIGLTNDLKRRIQEHRLGKVHTTYRYRDFELIYFEGFISEKDARRREKYFKTTKGKKSLKLILRETLK